MTGTDKKMPPGTLCLREGISHTVKIKYTCFLGNYLIFFQGQMVTASTVDQTYTN
jgi:hypothetical protein